MSVRITFKVMLISTQMCMFYEAIEPPTVCNCIFRCQRPRGLTPRLAPSEPDFTTSSQFGASFGAKLWCQTHEKEAGQKLLCLWPAETSSEPSGNRTLDLEIKSHFIRRSTCSNSDNTAKFVLVARPTTLSSVNVVQLGHKFLVHFLHTFCTLFFVSLGGA